MGVLGPSFWKKSWVIKIRTQEQIGELKSTLKLVGVRNIQKTGDQGMWNRSRWPWPKTSWECCTIGDYSKSFPFPFLLVDTKRGAVSQSLLLLGKLRGKIWKAPACWDKRWFLPSDKLNFHFGSIMCWILSLQQINMLKYYAQYPRIWFYLEMGLFQI